MLRPAGFLLFNDGSAENVEIASVECLCRGERLSDSAFGGLGAKYKHVRRRFDRYVFKIIGVKPSTMALPDMAVLGNQQALCPLRQVLAEYEDIHSIDDARDKCLKHSCSHFTWDVVGARSNKKSELKLRLWCVK